jgi:hypothetical protein
MPMCANLNEMLVTGLGTAHGVLSKRFGMHIELHRHKLHNARRDLPLFKKRAMEQPHQQQIESEPEAIGRATAGLHLEHVFWRQPKEAS